MLYLVRMDVALPQDLSADDTAELLAREKNYSQEIQRDGRWKEIWRVAGEYANYSVFDVADHDELHTILSGLPLFPHMKIAVTPLATHPSHI
ncbi:muconolactone Delta-isomerase [Brevibacterium sp. K11IcPPYGO002]|uniref:muconolactone Delta-isomerase n=1 Tax=Brevibacterium sp. K11IcPPYGO002 TaxID=3058837 RepID=UPI003D8195D2